MKQLRLRYLLLLLLSVCTARLGWAQGVTTSAMNGVITDQTGAGLPGATVIAVHQPTNTQYVAPTNSEGRFNIQNMRVGGPYTVRVTFIGYQEVNRENIFLTLGQNLRLDINLSEATQQLNEVVVSGRQDPVINSGRTGAATTIQREQIQRLPTLSRSFDDFTRLTPQANRGGLSVGGRSSNFNNVTIDGALFNNAFGLSSTIGGQTNSQPISLDAIEEIQVNLAPYDVRQGAFTGAGINAVTRSGTNTFTGSAYAFRRNDKLVADRVRDFEEPFQDFSLWQYGARVGGPIIKDKLFFFVSAESERRDDPPTGSGGTQFIANRPGVPAPGVGSSTSSASAAELDQLSSFLQDQYNYNPGPYEDYRLDTYSDKISAKLDWNINANNSFNFKYTYLKSYRDVPPSTSGAPANGRGLTNTNLPFLAAYYRINNNLNSYIAELNSKLSGRLSNSLQIGYTANRDFRESSGGIFPLVDIENGSNQAFTAFGFEPFSANNILNSDVYQLSDNLNFSVGKHVLTLGTYNEYYEFRNGFAPNFYGRYRYSSLADFYSSAGFNYTPGAAGQAGTLAPRAGGPDPATIEDYELRYSAVGGDFPFADIKAYQLGFYAQDEYTVRPNLRLTAGIRVDIPVIDTEIARNEQAATLSFRNGEQIFTDQVQRTQLLWSPRVGFNWDVNDDQKTQLRGGTGIFTGRVPYVWISNQASNNGVLFGSFRGLTTPGGQPITFSPDVNAYREGGEASSTYNLATTARDFKFPQIWRTNLAVDQRLPGDVVLTLEGIYTQDVNAVYHENVNLPNSQLRAAGADNRVLYRNPANLNQTQVGTGANTVYFNRINGNISDAIVMKNTSKGYSYTLTAQLQKTFSNGLSASLAYNYADARSVNDGGSIANSIWRDRQVTGDPNDNVLSYSSFLQQHRAIASLTYRREYINHLATGLSLFFDAGPGFRYSYTYNGDLNGDNNFNNDLIYIPRNESEIVLRDIPIPAAQGGGTYTAAQQWAALDQYISQDDYLNERRGEYAERNGAVAPWTAILDARLLQDVFVNIGKTKNTLQFSVDVFNFGNLLNKNWGVSQNPNRNGLISFSDFDQSTGRPRFTYPYLNNPSRATDGTVTPGQELVETDRYNTGEGSRWRIQLGLRYIFN